MKINDAIKYFGNQSQLAKSINIDRQEVNRWVQRGYIPYNKQIIIEKESNNVLKRDNKKTALKRERFNMHVPKNSIFNKDEDEIISLYDNGVKITDIHKKFNYGKYHTLRKFILKRVELRKMKAVTR